MFGSDRELITRLRRDDAAALQILLQRYGTVGLRYATRMTGSADLAEELVQDVFFDLWEHRHVIEEHWDLAAYLFGRIRQRALDIVRANRRTSMREGSWATRESQPANAVNAAEGTLEAEEVRARLWRALENVPPRCREIFMMVWDRHLPYADVAAELGISVPTVKNQMSRAFKHLVGVFGQGGELS